MRDCAKASTHWAEASAAAVIERQVASSDGLTAAGFFRGILKRSLARNVRMSPMLYKSDAKPCLHISGKAVADHW
jgi:hypothetical protein